MSFFEENMVFGRFKKREKDFNVVIEGSYYGHWSEMNYELARIDISQETDYLKDKDYTYWLCAMTDDFKDIQRVAPSKEGLEQSVGSFSDHNLLVLGVAVQIPLEPRAICTKDGRVYLRENLIRDFYAATVPDFVDMAGKFFNDERFSEAYREHFC